MARELSAWDEAATHWEGALEVMARARRTRRPSARGCSSRSPT